MDNITNNNKKLIIKLITLVLLVELELLEKRPKLHNNIIINPAEIINANNIKNILLDKSLGILDIPGCLNK
jgi:hypothetical protein